ncbi:DUF2802 domain-containing protein [Aromatoleum toluvorans]|uniref:DUF2802 domain-containing protein n=1 Tax=Aromatoleum toluvorans TaxID=92002 RepID=A0ABX1PUM8_9RHOO|nr:DUF2802 domain-containing protein [Aromatoleum toluvorans]NMG43158.1 DUF2802 domain-containing protein [Aromatoleum toluvorans]
MGLREIILAAIALLAVYIGYQLYRVSRVPRAPASAASGEPGETIAEPGTAEGKVDEDEAGEAGELYRFDLPPPAVASASPVPDAFQHELEVRQLRRELEQQRTELADLRRALDELREQIRAPEEQADASVAPRGASPEYDEALVFARRGLDAETIAERCGITVAEAELVQSLARSQAGDAGTAA